MRKLALSFALLVGLSGTAPAVDWELAKKYEKMFSAFTQEGLTKHFYAISVKKLFKLLKEGNVVLLDVRTPAEASIVGLTYKNSLHIPLNELFKEENLKKIPTDKPVVVICHSGARALVATTALRSV